MIHRRTPFAVCLLAAAHALAGCAGSPDDDPGVEAAGSEVKQDARELAPSDPGDTPADWIVCKGDGVSAYLWRMPEHGEVFTLRVAFGTERHDRPVHRYREWTGVYFLDVIGASLQITTAFTKTTEKDDPWKSEPFPATLKWRVHTEGEATSYDMQCRGPGSFMPFPDGS